MSRAVKRRVTHPHVAAAAAYARDVVAGRILACRYVKLACERHLDGLKQQRRKSYPYKLDQKAAEKVCRFIELLPHVKGKWARDRERIRLEPWQCFIVVSVFGWIRKRDGLRRYRTAYIEVPRKNAKALALDTPVPTPAGWTTMGAIRVGDVVFDERGAPCVVTAATEVMRDHRCFRVTFSDGTSIIADAGHEWFVDARRNGLPRTGLGPKASWRDRHIRTTQQVAESLYVDLDRRERNYSVPVAGALQTAPADLPVHPYVLGVWLGDGHSSSAAFTCAYADAAIVQEVGACGYPVWERRSSNNNSGLFALDQPRSARKAKAKGATRRALEALGVWQNKHIPPPYLRSSYAQRLALLQGLMDTDGTVSEAGQCSFTTTLPQLLDGFVELARSLGLKPTTRRRRARIGGRDCGDYYTVQFWAWADQPAFRLPRKAARQRPRPPQPRPRSLRRQIVGCEEVPSVPVRCIQVSSRSSLYLAGAGMVPTHNSTLTAGVGLYMLTADGEHGAEVYAGAGTEKQAWEVFGPARLMARQTPALCEQFGVHVGAKNLHILRNASKFEPIIGKPGDGASPSFSITDEYHEHATSDQFDTMVTGMGAREQPIAWVITTAGADTAGPCYNLREQAVEVLEGKVERDEFFAIIYTIDEGDDWTTEAALRKSNPNIGVSVSEEFLRTEQLKAISNPRDQATFKTKHTNVWVTAAVPYFDAERWARLGDPSLVSEQFRGESCVVGLDLNSKIDLAAKVKLFWRDQQGSVCAKCHGEKIVRPDEDAEPAECDRCKGAGVRTEPHYYAFGSFYIPAARADEPENRHYADWVGRGHLIATPGDITDFDYIEADILDDAERHGLVQVAADPWNATQLLTHLQNALGRDRVVEVPQTVTHLSEPMKEVQALIVDGRLHHDGNPAFAWCIGNVTAQEDRNRNVFPRKPAAEKKIDGAVALILAVGAALRRPSTPRGRWLL